MYSARASAQRTADAAALAGAFTFIVDKDKPQPGTARDHALQAALNNNVLGRPILASEVTINVDVPNRRVTVDINRSEGTYLARAFSTNSADLAVRAIAEAGPNAVSSSCVKPWFIPNTILAPVGPCAACTANQVMISGTSVTSYATCLLGTQISVKPQSPDSSIAPGQFYAIEVSGPGGSDYRDVIGK